ncbi:hypothetical protein CHS0354_042309 [Potamilus streckersoni]|uniref:C1q domain-containing protein n=1 Tax=Potamilus streckersoni TaxID=2493646 RepID=A0AAE0W2K2_9BIVA|nr:hypothetical protein CHS0354_042309 [Potamilus streckersoni]
MQSLIIFCTLFRAIYLGAANDKFNYGQDGGIISLLMKKIWDLEERDRSFDRKIAEIDVLRERLDEAQKQLLNMHELEQRLQKAEERIQMLIYGMDETNSDCNVNKSATVKVLDISETQANMEIGSSISYWIPYNGSGKDPRQTKMGDKITERVPFKDRIQAVTIPIGHSLLFDRVDYNEGNAYDARSGIFTCPVSGTYFFYTNIISMLHSAKVQTQIIVEGLGKGKTHAFGDADADQGSTAAALHCNAGQRVWVECTLGSETWGQMYSTFTGILLWPDDAATSSN